MGVGVVPVCQIETPGERGTMGHSVSPTFVCLSPAEMAGSHKQY